jgi:hypothetical protein
MQSTPVSTRNGERVSIEQKAGHAPTEEVIHPKRKVRSMEHANPNFPPRFLCFATVECGAIESHQFREEGLDNS